MWVPFSVAPQNRRERLWFALRRYGFVIACGLTAVLFCALVIFLPEDLARPPAEIATSGAGGAETPPSNTPASSPAASSPAAAPRSDRGSIPDRQATTKLSVTTRPAGTTVLVDEDSAGSAPLQIYPLATGVHRLSIRKEGYVSLDTVVTLTEAQPVDLSVTLSKQRDRSMPALAARQTKTARSDLPEPVSEPEPSASEPASASERSSSEPSEPEPSGSEPPGQRSQRSEALQRSQRSATSRNPGASERPDRAGETQQTTGTLRLLSQPVDALVLVDGQLVGRTPLRVTGVPAGLHEVTLQASGHESRTRNVTVRAADTRTVETSLTPLTGTLSVLVKPWGKIYVDGVLRESEADVRHNFQLPVGNHQLSVVHPKLGRWEKTTDIEASKTTWILVNFKDSSSPAASSSERESP